MTAAMQEHPPEPLAPVPPLRLAVAGTLLVLFFYFPAQLTQVMNAGFGIWFTEAFVFFGLAFVLVRMSGRNPVRYPGLHWNGFGSAGFGFAVGAVNFFALAIPLQLLAVWLFPESWSQAYDSGRLLRDRLPADLLLIVLGVTIAAPIGEEYFFRGVLQRALFEAGTMKKWAALVLAGAIFSGFHLDPVGFAARLELGVVFGWLYFRTGSIWPGAMAHAANNLVSVVVYFLSPASGAAASSALTRAEVQQTALVAVLGLIGVSGLSFIAWQFPSVLTPRRPPEDPRAALPPRSFYALLWPWALAAALSIAVLLAVDLRGVRLSWFDARHPLSEVEGAEAAKRRELLELRLKARSGEVPLDAYFDARRALAPKKGG